MKFHIIRFAGVPSTMDVCRTMALQGAPEGTTIIADEQSTGRGHDGHKWYSPIGTAVYLSVLLRPSGLTSRDAHAQLTLLGALAICDVVENIAGSCDCHHRAQIKWPNDVMINGLKLAGSLAECSWSGAQIDYAILGIGLNVSTDFSHAPDSLNGRATSLTNAFNIPLGVPYVTDCLLAAVEARYAELYSSDNNFAHDYASLLETVGKKVVISQKGTTVTGVATGVTSTGRLVVATPKSVVEVSYGELSDASPPKL